MKKLVSIFLTSCLAMVSLYSQTASTAIFDTIASPSGGNLNGTATISWGRYLNDADPRQVIYPGQTTINIVNGVVSTSLFPNTAAFPAGSCYKVAYTLNGINSIRYWNVPISSSPVTLNQIEGNFPCTPTQGSIISPAQINPGAPGLTQVLTSNTSGQVSWVNGGGGGGGTPGGSNGQIQYNNLGSFGGFTFGGDCSFSRPNLICTKTNGVAFATSATVDTTNASNITSGILSIPRGGTGANSLSGAGIALTINPLNQFALTSSAQLFSIISNPTGTGQLVFNNSPTFISPSLGTPASGIGTNLTGIPLNAAVVGVLSPLNGGTGIANTSTLTLGSSSINFASLGTGIVKNTTTTGALTSAVAADVYGLFSGSCSSSTFLRGDGSCQTPPGAGTVTNTGGTLTSHAVILGNGSSDVKALSSLGTSGQVLTSNGAGADPTWQPGGGSGSVAWSANGSSIGTSNTANFVGSSGITIAGTFPGSVATVTVTPDTTIIQTKANLQTGTAPTVIASASASATTYTASSTPSLASYSTNASFRWTVDTTNTCTSACTLNINSLGAKTVSDNLGNNLVAGALSGGSTYTITYNGTKFLCAECGIVATKIPPYTLCASGCSATVPASGTVITAVAHAQGPGAVIFCWDGATPHNWVTCGAGNSAASPLVAGDVTLTYATAPTYAIIWAPSGGSGGSGGGGATSVFAGSTAITPAFSTTPVFGLGDISNKSPVRIEPGAMTANVTSVTFSSTTAGARGSITWLQDSTGGRTVTYGGSTVNTCQIIPSANVATTQEFEVAADGTTIKGTGCFSSVGTVPTVQNCGTSSSCAGLSVTNPQLVIGSVSLVSGSPSSVTVTGVPFAFSTSYFCTATTIGVATGVALSVNNISGSSFQITSPSATSASVGYQCVGN